MFRNKQDKHGLSPRQEDLAQRIAGGIINVQRRIATYLNCKTAHYSKAQKEILLLAISVIFSGISLYLIFTAIT